MSSPKFDWEANREWEDELNFRTLVTEFEDGKEQRRSKGDRPRVFRLEFSKQTLTNDDAEEIWQFFKDREGRYEPFYWDYEKSDGTTEEIEVRFNMDTLSRNAFLNILYNFGLEFKEVF